MNENDKHKEGGNEVGDRRFRQAGGWLVWIGTMVWDKMTEVNLSELEGVDLYFKVATYIVAIYFISGVRPMEVVMILREGTRLLKEWRQK